MRIAVYIGRQQSEAGGGYTFQEDILLALVELAGTSKHEFVLLSPDTQSPLLQSLPANMSTVSFRSSRFAKALGWIHWLLPGKGSPLLLANSLQRVCRRNNIEFVWFVSATGFEPVDTPYMTVVWDLQHRIQPWFPEVSSGGQWALREWYFSWMLKRASLIVAGNETGRREIERSYGIPSNRMVILPHPTPRFALEHRPSPGTDSRILERYGLTPGYLFYPAQFWPHKNHLTVLRAVELLEQRLGLRLTTVFVGSDKGTLDRVRSAAQRFGLEQRVHILGFVSRNDLISLYQHALCLVYASFFGPENLPPLEAFALGCPVIASNVDGAKDQLGNAAILFEPASAEQLAEKIEEVAGSEAVRSELIKRGRSRATSWSSKDYVAGAMSHLDTFESYRRCWDVTA